MPLGFWLIAPTLLLRSVFAAAPSTQQETVRIAKAFKTSFCDTGAGWVQEWEDEFNGDKLDTSTWETVLTKPQDGATDSPVGGLDVTACRSAQCRSENVRVHGGYLHLHSERDSTDGTKYFTGAVTTKGKRSWTDAPQYRLCVSAKLPGSGGASGKGVWPAHWMLPDNGISDQCLDEGEMDIMEMVNGDGGVYNTYHWMSSWPGQSLKHDGTCPSFDTFHQSKHQLNRMSKTWSTHFHEYGVERSGEHMAFAVDGVPVINISASEVNTQLSHTPFFLILNTAIGGGWPGEPSGSTLLPTDHVIDYVRVARRADNGPSGGPSSGLIRSEESSILQHAQTSARKGGSGANSALGFPSSMLDLDNSIVSAEDTLTEPPPPLSMAFVSNNAHHKVSLNRVPFLQGASN